MVSARSFFIFHLTIAFLQLHLVFLKAQLSMEHFFSFTFVCAIM